MGRLRGTQEGQCTGRNYDVRQRGEGGIGEETRGEERRREKRRGDERKREERRREEWGT